ncbi:MAG: hypothetical protein WCV50_01305 [Patescibacteria group bacterium]|jgi:hypothetical protein
MLKKLFKFILFLIPTLAIILIVAYVVFNHVPVSTYAVQETNPQDQWGTITGSLSYPSETIPPMGICAKSVKGVEMFCTYKMIQDDKYANSYGYELSVPPDNYYVFAHLITAGKENIGYTDEYQAYYSKFVTCGQLVECTSHKAIKVEVSNNQKIDDIDPVDWYNT